MYVSIVLLIIILLSSIIGIIEYSRHQKRIYSIPIRIHVNGTRGKSSVTRLIGAALREGGVRTITKVTGTYPRLILEDGSEARIYRKESPNIIEQLSIVKYAAKRKAEALVMECMALQPQYQWITEKQMIHSTIGIITNVRLDHVDIMGYTLPEVAKVLSKTIPNNQNFFMTENDSSDILRKTADKNNSIIHISDRESISNKEMEGFNYIEHKENVAMALAVCEHLKVDRNTALNGMHKANPDAGALKLYRVNAFNKVTNFYNAFAANDFESTLLISNMIKEEIGFKGPKIILLNTRHDRMDRAKQLTEMLGKNLGDEMDYLMLIGQSTDVVKDLSISEGVDRSKIINLGWVEPSLIFEKVLSYTEDESTVIAIGNMGGMGGKVADFFEHRSNGHG
jgi:poly-gamma-glutamate synthase PgsB/CapB